MATLQTIKKASGFALGYALFALAILSLTIAALARVNGQGADGKRMADTRDEVIQQVNLIRAKLIACSVYFPGGDNGLGYRLQLPVTPTSSLVVDAVCPGNPNTNKSIWSLSDGVYMPRSLTGLSSWSYKHDASSARISITAVSGGNAMTAALNNAALRFGVQASVSGSTLTLLIAN